MAYLGSIAKFTYRCGGVPSVPYDFGDILLNTSDIPTKIYAYNPDSKVSTLLSVPNILSTSSDIAHTINKLWLYEITGGVYTIKEWDINLNPFSAVFNRSITNPKISTGLHAISNSLLIGNQWANPASYYEMDITGVACINTIIFNAQPWRIITGDYILTTTGKLISLEISLLSMKQYIIQYDYSTGIVEIDIDLSSIFSGTIWSYGLFEYDGEIYIAGDNGIGGVIYKIDKIIPYSLTLYDTTPYRISGASQLNYRLTEHFII